MADIQKNFHRLQRELENRSLTTTVIESGILTIILLVALLGNILVCRAVYQSPRLRTITNYSVIVLALTDVCVAVFIGPFVFSVSILGERKFGSLLCYTEAYITAALVYSSIFTVTFMSVNRYFKIVKSDHLYRRVFTRRKTLLMLFVTIAIAWLGPLPSLLQGPAFVFHPGKMKCCYFYTKEHASFGFIIFSSIYFLIPYCVTILCYCGIYIKVRLHNKRIANAAPSTTNTTTTINRRDINITKTLFAIFIVFTFCVMQLVVIDSIEFSKGMFDLPRLLYVFYTAMCGLASAANPFIYGLLSPAFRSEYKRCLSALKTLIYK